MTHLIGILIGCIFVQASQHQHAISVIEVDEQMVWVLPFQ